MADNRCEQCLTEGITILPARWGCSIEISSTGQAEISYPQRILREGYIYVIDNNNKWYGYVITEGRYLKNFTVTGLSSKIPYPKEPDLPYKDSKCLAGNNCKTLNSFIRIPNPSKDITTLWLAYSPVKWTKAVIDRHQNDVDSAKKENMIKINLSGDNSDFQEAGDFGEWLYGSDSQSESLFGNLPLEYGNIGSFQKRERFIKPNPFTNEGYLPNKEKEAIELNNALISYARKEINTTGQENKIFSVTVYDPIGKLIDLNELMIQHEDSLAKKYSIIDKHKLEVANIINGLEHSIKSSVKERLLLDDNEKRIKYLRDKKLVYFSPRENISKYNYNYDNDLEITANLNIPINEAKLLKVKTEQEADKVWREDYEKLYKKQQMNAFMNSDSVLKIERDFKRVAKYIIRIHNDIFKNSENLKSQMQFNYDNNDISSGMSYTETILECIGVTVNDSETVKLYAELMGKDINDQQSYILRALAYNYQSYIDAITKEGNKNISWQNLDFSTSGIKLNNVLEASWSSLIGIASSIHTDDILNKSALIQKSTEILSAPLLKVISNEASSITISQTMYAIGLHLESPIIQLRFSGTKKQAIAGLTDVLLTQTDASSKTSARTYARLLMHNLKVLDNIDLNANISGTTLVIDTKEANSVFNTLNKNNAHTEAAANARFQALQTSASSGHQGALADLKTAQADLKRYNQIVDLASNEFVQIIEPKIASNSISNKLATAGTLFQAVACMSLAAGIYSNSTEHGLQKAIVSEGGAKLVAGIGFLYGGILDQHVAMQEVKVKSPALSVATKESLERSISKSAWWAKRLNIGSAIIFSSFDIYHAYDEFKKGNGILTALYLVSAGAGLGAVAAVTLFSASLIWTGIGAVLFIITIGVGFLIAELTLTPIQEWIKGSIWGVDSLHLSHKSEIEAYKVAIASITESKSSEEDTQSMGRGSTTSTNDNSVASTNHQKSTTNFDNDIPDYQYVEASQPLKYEYIEYDNTFSNIDLDSEVRRNLELSEQQRRDWQNSTWPEKSGQDRQYYGLLEKPRQPQSEPRFQVLGTNEGGSSVSGLDPDIQRKLIQARQRTADQAKRAQEQEHTLAVYQDKVNKQNQKLERLQRQLDALKNK